MKVLIVYAYPNHQGLNAQILARVQAGLAGRHEVKTLDLYLEHKEKGFDPCLVFNQDHKRRDLDKDPQMAPYRDLVTWADHLIFIYPIWWGGMPAVLKGFVDRVLVKGFAYDYSDNPIPQALLKNGLGHYHPRYSRLLRPPLHARLWSRFSSPYSTHGGH